MEEIDPSTTPRWNEWVQQHAGACIFHSAEWATVLQRSYGFRPRYLVDSRRGRLSTLVPIMDVVSVLTGRRGVGLPFSDYCPPLHAAGDARSLAALLEPALRLGRRRGWSSLELRCEDTAFGDVAPSNWYAGHVLNLDASEDELLAGMRPNYRNELRAAERHGVKVSFESSEQAMRRFYRLHCATRKRLGVPPQPWHFFEQLSRRVVGARLGVVGLASLGGEDVAALVMLQFNGKAIYKYGASLLDDRKLHAPRLLVWEALRHAKRAGCREFCFGRTDPAQEGLLRFKQGWGTTPRRLNAYCYDFRSDAFRQGNVPAADRRHDLFKKLPVPLLRAMGSLLYRHAA